MDERASLFSIQHFSLHDGPGIRTTVFFKGCNLRCFWCHNPESQCFERELLVNASRCIGCGECVRVCPSTYAGHTAVFTSDCRNCFLCAEVCCAEAVEICGFERNIKDLFEEIASDYDAYRRSGGGVTFSGGEPFLQSGFLLSVLKLCREAGIHTAVETAVCLPFDIIAPTLPFIDLLYCDLKCMDSQKHLEATGAANNLTLENIRRISESGVNMIVRIPVIPGFNDDEESMTASAVFVRSLKTKPKVELLPFHSMCAGKYEALGRRFEASGVPVPSKSDIERLEKYFEQ